MRFVFFFIALSFIWFGFAYLLVAPGFLSLIPFASNLKLPESWNELGDALGVLNGLFNSIAILLGLISLYMQGRQINESIVQQKLSNDISAKIAKQQFLMREAERLEADIQRLKSSGNYDQNLFNNMVNKKSRYMKEACRLADDILNSVNSG